MVSSVGDYSSLSITWFRQTQPNVVGPDAGSTQNGGIAAKAGAPGNSDNQISAGSHGHSRDVLHILLEAQQTTASPSSSPNGNSPYRQGSFQEGFQNLLQGLQSGDPARARKAFDELSKLNDGTNGVSFDNIGVPNPVQQLVAKIGQNLQAGNLAGAQQLVTPAQTEGPSAYHQGDFQNQLHILLQTIQSGDLTAARQAYSDISQLNTGKNGITFDSLSVPKSIQHLLGQIGSNLQSFNLQGAVKFLQV